MAEVSEIEAGGEVRTIKDTTARQGVAANAAAIEEINAKIPADASSSNKMATQADLKEDYTQDINVTGRFINYSPGTATAKFIPLYKGAKKGTLWGQITLPYTGQGGLANGTIASSQIKTTLGLQITVAQNGNPSSRVAYAMSLGDFYVFDLASNSNVNVMFSAFVELN